VPLLLRRYSLRGNTKNVHPIFLYGAGFCTLVPALVGIVTLRFDFGSKYLLLVLGLVWAADIGAFFVGKYFGKHKLASKISPGKTIEGVVGGIVAAAVVAIFAGITVHLHVLAWVLWLLLVIVTVLWSIIGDLFESMLKRMADVKDSGTLLPGHGGFYDRIDSMTAAVPIFTLGLLLLRI
jgi:phosphatidate cytidylyltransferase